MKVLRGSIVAGKGRWLRMRGVLGWAGGLAFTVGGVVLCSCMSPDFPLDVNSDPKATDCSTAKMTYEDFGAKFFQSYCIRCHSVALETDWERVDAPMKIDFDTLEMAREFDQRIRLRAAVLGDMPPRLMLVPYPDEEERIQLMKWIDCGMKSQAELNSVEAADEGG